MAVKTETRPLVRSKYRMLVTSRYRGMLVRGGGGGAVVGGASLFADRSSGHMPLPEKRMLHLRRSRYALLEDAPTWNVELYGVRTPARRCTYLERRIVRCSYPCCAPLSALLHASRDVSANVSVTRSRYKPSV